MPEFIQDLEDGDPTATRRKWERDGIPYNTPHGMERARGKVIDLGFGIERRGLIWHRPLIWYAALGYVSGFPVRYVLWWVFRFKLLAWLPDRTTAAISGEGNTNE